MDKIGEPEMTPDEADEEEVPFPRFKERLPPGLDRVPEVVLRFFYSAGGECAPSQRRRTTRQQVGLRAIVFVGRRGLGVSRSLDRCRCIPSRLHGASGSRSVS
jgi:hypothetical protein